MNSLIKNLFDFIFMNQVARFLKSISFILIIIAMFLPAIVMAKSDDLDSIEGKSESNGLVDSDKNLKPVMNNSKTTSGDASFIGDPDPLDILEKKKNQNLIINNNEPIFEDISELLDESNVQNKSVDTKKSNDKEVTEKADKILPEPLDKPIEVNNTSVEQNLNQKSDQESSLLESNDQNSIEKNNPNVNSNTVNPEIANEGLPVKEENKDEFGSNQSSKIDLNKDLSMPLKNNEKKNKKSKKNPFAISGDDPDLRKEEALHKIYKRYNSKPTSDATWGEVTANRKSMIYVVQKGDNLFEISETLFGDPSYWPKVWSINSDLVYNPHSIRPNLNIKFYPGDGNLAPSIAFSPIDKELENEIQKNLKPGETRSPLVQVKIEEEKIPENLKRTPDLKNLPEHFKSVVVPEQNFGKVKNAISFDELNKIALTEVLTYIPFSIFEKPAETQGKIVEGPDGANIVSDFQNCLVEVENGEVGQTYYAINQQQLSSDQIPEKFDDQLFVYENLGSLKLIAVVDDSKKIFRAQVQKAIGYLTVGSKLIKGGLPTYNAKYTSIENSTPLLQGESQASVLSGLNIKFTSLSSQYSYVLISAGAANGLAANSRLKIYPNLQKRNKNLNIEKSNLPIGIVRVVSLTDKFSIGFVTRSTQPILVGDIIE